MKQSVYTETSFAQLSALNLPARESFPGMGFPLRIACAKAVMCIVFIGKLGFSGPDYQAGVRQFSGSM